MQKKKKIAPENFFLLLFFKFKVNMNYIKICCYVKNNLIKSMNLAMSSAYLFLKKAPSTRASGSITGVLYAC